MIRLFAVYPYELPAMKIEHKKAADPLKDLTPLQKKTLIVATVVAFLGIFVWFVKILFF
jgi:hypothetical protein